MNPRAHDVTVLLVVLVLSTTSAEKSTSKGATPSHAYTEFWPPRNNERSIGSATDRRGIFINGDSPIPINGTAVAWHYCYYPPTNTHESVSSYTTQLGLFRGISGMLDSFHQISGTVTEVTKSRWQMLAVTELTCDIVRLERDDQFAVVEGDLLGVCLHSSNSDDDEEALVTVAEDIETEGETVKFAWNDCDDFDDSDEAVLLVYITTLRDAYMHVSIEIEPEQPLPTVPSPTTFSSSSSSPSSSSSRPPPPPPPLPPPPSPPPTTSITSRDVYVKSSLESLSFVPQSTLVPTPPTTTINKPRAMETLTSHPSEIEGSETGIVRDLQTVTIIGVSVGSVLVVVAPAACMLVVIVLVHRRQKRISRTTQQNRADDLVIPQPDVTRADQNGNSIPYEVPRSVFQMYSRVIPELNLNRVTSQTQDVFPASSHDAFDPYASVHAFDSFITDCVFTNSSAPRYEFDQNFLEQQSTQEVEGSLGTEYNHLNSTPGAPKSTKDNLYSTLCQHYYTEMEQAVQEHQSSCESSNHCCMYLEPADTEEDLIAEIKRQNLRNIPVHEVRITSRLGSGQFGSVRKGVWRPEGDNECYDVAVKTIGCVQDEPNKDRVKLLQEAAIMGQFSHPNVIKLLGIAIGDKLLMVIMEFASLGDLENHLMMLNPLLSGKPLPPNTPNGLLCYAQQIVLGMHYLSNKGFVHRDLAARNILLFEGLICKIADFGMSRDLGKEDYYTSQGGVFPVKWTAPEAINYRKFSTASDIWSYGCLLYEIWSLGKEPFIRLSNREALEKVETGYRLPPPPGCPRAVYSMMIQCWHPSPRSRPSFRDLMVDLMEPEEKILSLPQDAAKEARTLGGHLKTSQILYLDLQKAYC